MTDDNRILAGMGEFKVSHNPHILGILGLGSCVGVALYIKKKHFGGLAHIMLPSSKEFNHNLENPVKYADTGIVAMLDKMHSMFGDFASSEITAKIAGGAHMFPTMTTSSTMDIGKRNVESVKNTLESLSIRLVAEDTGGNHGRTIYFDLTTGLVSVNSLGKKTLIL